MKILEPIKPWFIEEPTAPDDVVGHAAIRKALKPYGIGVATGEHAHNRVCLYVHLAWAIVLTM
jgi:L-fuconate dehydratase